MNALQIKGQLARIGELTRKPSSNDQDEIEVGQLVLNLLEDFLLDHKRQTELLGEIASTAQFFDNQRREGMF